MTESDMKVIAALYIKGDRLMPQDVSAALGILPTTSQVRGEARVTSSGTAFTIKTGLWAVVVERDSADVSAVIYELLEALGPQPGLATLPYVEEVYFDVFVAGVSDEDGDGTCSLELPVWQVNALSTYGLPVRVTVAMGKP
ncbi:DUF4279 domain-containing protein [Amantichitinum ursilacus]|uniref:DUF4279 domain-containing protein n=1 Tax=Amantichitinum ursilacus TaxID=857265 RepID=UPI0009FA3905|nr:DUF4279 domain-containing protein [Amantichitinum ursilacus]